ncbi:hypothetical protein LJR030_000578 [Rhizobium sp. LjRoot30]|uniref:hypothetical protein n=1 Tax=Rhizobium sp. LjRoot30 TaxID=3342320 RepID=UPI003ED047AE
MDKKKTLGLIPVVFFRRSFARFAVEICFRRDALQALHVKFGIQKIRMPVSRRPISISRSKQIAANVRTVISEAPIPRTIIAHSSAGIIANLHLKL